MTELLLYLSIASFLVAVTFRYCLTCYTVISCQSMEIQHATEMSSGCDLCIYELSCSPADAKAWKVQKDTAIIWHQMGVDYGWQLEEDKLIRMQGTYREDEARWHSCVKSIVFAGVSRMSITFFQIDEWITHIGFHLQHAKNERIDEHIALENKIII